MAAGEFSAGVRGNYRPEMRENMDITAKAHKIARKAFGAMILISLTLYRTWRLNLGR